MFEHAGLQERLSNEPHKVLIAITEIEELRRTAANENELTIGSALTIHDLHEVFKQHGKIRVTALAHYEWR